MEERWNGRGQRIFDALGFQLSMQFWIGLLSGIVFGVFALIAWIIR